MIQSFTLSSNDEFDYFIFKCPWLLIQVFKILVIKVTVLALYRILLPLYYIFMTQSLRLLITLIFVPQIVILDSELLHFPLVTWEAGATINICIMQIIRFRSLFSAHFRNAFVLKTKIKMLWWIWCTCTKKKWKQNIRTNILLSISKIREIRSNITYYQAYLSAVWIGRATIRAKKITYTWMPIRW